MGFVIWVVIGGIIGWLASMAMRMDAQHSIVLNMLIGMAGALLGGWLLSPALGNGTINADDFNALSLVVSFMGAVLLLTIVNVALRRRLR